MGGLEIDERFNDVVELGCGYGTFTIPVARAISGTLFTFDIDAGMIARTRQRVAQSAISNVVAQERDVLSAGFGLPPGPMDAVLLFNILHGEDPIGLLELAAEVLRPGGAVLVTHWRSDICTPRGPAMEVRPTVDKIRAWAAASKSLRPGESLILPPWHFGMRLIRTE